MRSVVIFIVKVTLLSNSGPLLCSLKGEVEKNTLGYEYLDSWGPSFHWTCIPMHCYGPLQEEATL